MLSSQRDCQLQTPYIPLPSLRIKQAVGWQLSQSSLLLSSHPYSPLFTLLPSLFFLSSLFFAPSFSFPFSSSAGPNLSHRYPRSHRRSRRAPDIADGQIIETIPFVWSLSPSQSISLSLPFKIINNTGSYCGALDISQSDTLSCLNSLTTSEPHSAS